MAKGKSNLELACEVFWGEYVDHSDCILIAPDNPESKAIFNQILSSFSDEAYTFTRVLMTLPDEMFTQTGRVIQKDLIKYMKEHFNWSAQKTLIVRDEIANALCS
jgi:hypothetical protein